MSSISPAEVGDLEAFLTSFFEQNGDDLSQEGEMKESKNGFPKYDKKKDFKIHAKSHYLGILPFPLPRK
jgi:hypothetical protein